MEHYNVKITEINEDDEYFCSNYKILFTDTNNNNLAKFELDICEICLDIGFNKYENFNKLDINNKSNILKQFVQDLIDGKNNIELNFIMSNGERIIQVVNNIMYFKIYTETIGCEFCVKINDNLVDSFKHFLQ